MHVFPLFDLGMRSITNHIKQTGLFSFRFDPLSQLLYAYNVQNFYMPLKRKREIKGEKDIHLETSSWNFLDPFDKLSTYFTKLKNLPYLTYNWQRNKREEDDIYWITRPLDLYSQWGPSI